MFTRTALPLSRAATSTFEELALLFAAADPLDAPGDAATPAELHAAAVRAAAPPLSSGAAASVSFQGPGSGRVVVAVSAPLLPAIAANLLGADAAPEPRLQQDALGELANVLCGTLLPALAGPAATFQLGAPRPLDPAGAAQPGPGEQLAGATRLVLDEGEAVALLFADLSAAGEAGVS